MKRPLATLALAFTFGATPALSQHTVTIAWSPSADAAANPSLTYNVYRAPACPGQFAKLNISPVASTTYLDTSVATGAAYCYQVTAVLNGVESTPSNQAIAAIPPPANRQTACEHRGPIIGWIRCVAARPKKTAAQSQAP